jgi:glycosyltransferase involved in cell wall biosynthesis
MKIFYLCDLPLFLNDAPSIHIYEIAKNLDKIGNKVTLFAPSIHKLNFKTSFKIVYTPALSFFISLLYHPLLIFVVIWHTILERPDVVYLRQAPFMILPLMFFRLINVPIISEVNGTQEEEMLELVQISLIQFLLRHKVITAIEAYSYKLSDKIITVTPGLKTYLTKKFKINPNKIIILENGVETDEFKPLHQAQIQKKLNLDSKYLQIGYFGKITVLQGVDYIIKAFNILIKTHKNIRLVIVGSGQEKKEYMQLAHDLKLSEFITFVDAVPHELAAQYINAFDVCISYPTLARDGLTSPFKIYEYLSCGKPIVASNISDVGNKFKGVAMIAKPDDEKDLAKQIELLITDKNLREKLGKAAREFIINGHSWESVARKTEEIAHTLLK